MENKIEEIRLPQTQNKKGRRAFRDTIFWTCMTALFIITFGEVLIDKICKLFSIEFRATYASFSFSYFSFIGIWIITLIITAIFKRNRFLLTKFWTGKSGNTLKMLGIGLLAGFLMNLICAVIALINGDIYIYFTGMNPLHFILFLFCVFVQSGAEELVCRGYMFEKLLRSYRPLTAILANSLLFAFLHIFNTGVTLLSLLNIAFFGILCSLICYYLDSLWCAMALHAGWNFTQNIILGLPNSGIVSQISVFRLDASSAGNSFAYNVGFGVEGTLTAVILLLALSVFLFLKYRNKKPSILAKPACCKPTSCECGCAMPPEADCATDIDDQHSHPNNI